MTTHSGWGWRGFDIGSSDAVSAMTQFGYMRAQSTYTTLIQAMPVQCPCARCNLCVRRQIIELAEALSSQDDDRKEAANFLLTFQNSPHTPKGAAWYLAHVNLKKDAATKWRELGDEKRVNATIESGMNMTFLRNNKERIFVGFLESQDESFRRLAKVCPHRRTCAQFAQCATGSGDRLMHMLLHVVACTAAMRVLLVQYLGKNTTSTKAVPNRRFVRWVLCPTPCVLEGAARAVIFSHSIQTKPVMR